jgi:hypothetical protein
MVDPPPQAGSGAKANAPFGKFNFSNPVPPRASPPGNRLASVSLGKEQSQ